MYCPKCGAQNPDDAKFCGSCGAPMPNTEPAATARTSPDRPNSPTSAADEPVSSQMKVGIAVLSVLVPIVGVVMGIIYMNKPTASHKAAGKMWLWIGAGMIVLYCIFSTMAGSLTY